MTSECISDCHELELELVEVEKDNSSYRSFTDWYEIANMKLDEILAIINERREKRDRK